MNYFDSWASLGRTAMAGIAAYGVLILMLRLSGKRTLAKLNAFDLVVTVALGSTLASVLTSRTLPLADGLFALLLLVALQFSIAWLSARWAGLRRLVKSEPELLLHDGTYLDEALREARLTRDEVRSAVRQAGIADVDTVRAVVLETDGSISVIGPSGGDAIASSLADVRHVPAPGVTPGEPESRG